jgi:hypothetical protein
MRFTSQTGRHHHETLGQMRPHPANSIQVGGSRDPNPLIGQPVTDLADDIPLTGNLPEPKHLQQLGLSSHHRLPTAGEGPGRRVAAPAVTHGRRPSSYSMTHRAPADPMSL